MVEARAIRAFNFVPDTNRLSGSVQISRRIGGATFHGGAFVTRLKQAGRRAPLQVSFDRDDTEVTTFSLDGAFDVPLSHFLGLNGFVKYARRRNDLDTEDFELAVSGSVQVDEYIKKRRELTGGVELSARPIAGTLLAAGYRVDHVDRDLRFVEPQGVMEAIRPQFALIEEESKIHTGYVRARARLLRSLQLSGELGYESVPDVALPRELKHVFYARGRGSYTLHRLPVTLALFGRFRDGHNDEIVLESPVGGRSKEKEFERTEWNYGATLTAVPIGSLVLFGSFVQQRDEQEFAYIRSDLARYDPSGVQFFLDSEPDYESDLRTLIVGATSPITQELDASLSSTLTWSRARLPESARTDSLLEEANEIRNRILSIEGRLGYQVNPGLRLEFGYRFDEFRDRRDHGLLFVRRDEEVGAGLDLDTDVHTFLLRLTLDLARLLR